MRLALEKIVELEKIEVTDADVDAQVEKMASDYGMTAERIKASVPVKEIAKDLAVNKAIDFIKENAVITEAAKKTAAKKTTKKTEEDKESK